jgi:predicted nuclease of predicted toxin-antitoxin system
VKLLLDEHYSRVAAEQPRVRGHDVVAVSELAQLRAHADNDALDWATGDGRAVVTENVDDFLRLHNSMLAAGRIHQGMILTTQRKFPRNAEAMRALITVLEELLNVLDSDDELQSDTYWL